MLDHGRQAHVERPGQLAHCGGTAAETFHQVASSAVTQRSEHVVDWLILKH
jgi:hypothetical protein